ncbi:MAG TPA: hypothetical protein VFB38_03720 [Chthonomonadaceae bacterium]|nr:hypothetical protein [Chthonomonadaceae bacterium]
MNQTQPWPRCPEAAGFFDRQLRTFAAANPPIEAMAARFHNAAGVLLQNLIDHWILPETPGLPEELAALGLVETVLPEGDRLWKHPQARLPGVRFKRNLQAPRLALAVEDIPLFAEANGLTLTGCHGDPDSRYQCGHVALPHGELMPIARRGYGGFAPGTLSLAESQQLGHAREALHSRDRSGSALEVITRTQKLVESVIGDIGRDRAVEEFFAAERAYYMTRNRAARWQYEQQQRIGIGWANHDHHTYRCSRDSFRALMQLWQTLGFEMRERFYAGAEAGWGAQILEHPVSRIILFCDLDLAPEELDIDFSRVDLAQRDTLGTIGLWCALHGDSVGTAGLHHLEAEFDFAQEQTLLEAAGFGVMAPFTDLPMLKQAFTEAEIWPVAPERVEALRARGLITAGQAERFLAQGAAGSHLEILQRWEGFKGFNKTGVSAIIQATDARKTSQQD